MRTTFIWAAIIGMVVVGGATPLVEAQQVNFLQLQMNDAHCASGAGTARGTPAGDNIWSTYASDSDNWDPDCVRLALATSIARELDVRVCMWLQDDGGWFGVGSGPGFEVCSPWASAGGGWSSWAHENGDMWAIDRMRIRVDSQAMPGRYISDMRVGYQSSRATSNVCSNGVGAIGYTPYMSGSGAWSSWIPDALNEGSIACGRINLSNPTVVTIVTPVTATTVSVNGGTYNALGSVTINQGDTIAIGWSAANGPQSCTQTAGPADFAASGVTGADTTVTEPTPGNSTTFTVTCTNEAGSHPDSVVVTTNPLPPVTTLSVSVNGGAYTSPAAVTIDYNDTLAFQWSGTNVPTSCNKSAGPADFAVPALPTVTDAVSTPAVGTATTYGVYCSNAGGGTSADADTIVVTNPYPDMTASVNNYGTYTQQIAANMTYGVASANNNAAATVSRLHFDQLTGGNNDFTLDTNIGALGVGGSSSPSPSVSFPAAGNWQVRSQADVTSLVTESNEANNYSAWDAFTVNPIPDPTATFEVRNVTTGSSWVTTDLDITEGNEVELRWTSTNAVGGCLGGSNPAGGGFSTGGATASTDTTITEPAVGTATDYNLTCTGGTGTTPATRQIQVTSYSATPYFSVTDTAVHPGDEVTFTWNTYLNDYTLCTFTGAGAPGTLSGASGSTDIVIQGASTYVVDCLGGTATVTVQVLPQFFES